MNKKYLVLVAILAPLMMTCGLAMDIYVPCVPFMPEALNTSEIIIQWTLSIFMIGVGLGQFIGGTLSDIHGRKRVMLASIFIYTISSILCALAESAWFLLLARAGQALASSGCIVTSNAIIRDTVESESSAKIYSILNGLNSLAPLLAPKLGGYLYIATGMWQSTFAFLALFGVVETLIVMFFLKETLPKEKRNTNKRVNWIIEQKYFLFNRQFVTSTLAGVLAMACLFTFFSISPILLIGNLGVSVSSFAHYFGLNALMFIFSTIVCTKLQNVTSTSNVLKIGVAVVMLSSLSMSAIASFYKLGVMQFMVPAVAMTFGAAFIFGPAISIAMAPFEERAGSAAAMYGASQNIIAALIGSLIINYSNDKADVFGLVIAIVSFLVLISLFSFVDYPSSRKNIPA